MAVDSTFERLNARHEELEGIRRSTVDNVRQLIADNLMGRGDFTAKRTVGTNRMAKIYDDTAKVSAGQLAGVMHSTMVSPVSPWFRLRFETPEFNDDDEATNWLYRVEQRLLAAISASRANFHAQLAPAYHDLVTYGLGVLFVDDVAGQGIRFSARPLQEIALAEDSGGRIDTVSRKFEFTARQAFDEWGDLAALAKKDLDAGNTEVKRSYVHIVLPNNDFIAGNLDASGMKWASAYLSCEDKVILDERGYHEMPYITPRWEQGAGETYGYGCGWNALSSATMQNQMRKLRMIAHQKAVSPPTMIDSEAVLPGDVDLNPNAIIPVNTIMASMSPPIQEIRSAANFQLSTEDIVDGRKTIQNAFHHQLIELLRDPRMTATQVLQLDGHMQRSLAPILGRQQTELAEPIVDRAFGIESRAGRLPPPPESIAGQKIAVDYENPVARAQKSSSAQAVISLTSYAAEAAAVDPGVLDVIDLDDGARKLAEALGAPVTMIRDSKEVERRREAARELAAQQSQMQEAVAVTDQIAKLAKAAPQPQQGA